MRYFVLFTILLIISLALIQIAISLTSGPVGGVSEAFVINGTQYDGTTSSNLAADDNSYWNISSSNWNSYASSTGVLPSCKGLIGLSPGATGTNLASCSAIGSNDGTRVQVLADAAQNATVNVSFNPTTVEIPDGATITFINVTFNLSVETITAGYRCKLWVYNGTWYQDFNRECSVETPVAGTFYVKSYDLSAYFKTAAAARTMNVTWIYYSRGANMDTTIEQEYVNITYSSTTYEYTAAVNETTQQITKNETALSKLEINASLASNVSATYYYDIYNFGTSQWETPVAAGQAIGTTETMLNITKWNSGVQNYINGTASSTGYAKVRIRNSPNTATNIKLYQDYLSLTYNYSLFQINMTHPTANQNLDEGQQQQFNCTANSTDGDSDGTAARLYYCTGAACAPDTLVPSSGTVYTAQTNPQLLNKIQASTGQSNATINATWTVTFDTGSAGTYGFKCNATTSNTNNAGDDIVRYVTVAVSDTAPPTWTNAQDNSSYKVYRGQPVNISTEWSDTGTLAKSWLSTNETGGWKNYTVAPYSIISLGGSGPSLVNWTWQNQTGVPRVIGWIIYANDSGSRANGTDSPGSIIRNFTMYGRSNITWKSPLSGISSTPGSSVLLVAFVNDTNITGNGIGSGPVANYAVKFYWENSTHSTSLGENMTNSSGHAIYYWDTTGFASGTYYPKANITNNDTLYYDVSNFNNTNITVSLTQTYNKSAIFNFAVSSPLSKNFIFLRASAQTFSSRFMLAPTQYLFKSLTQQIASISNTGKIFANIQSLAQSFTSNFVLAKSLDFQKMLSQFFSTTPTITRLYSFARSLTQAITENLVTTKIAALFKSLTQAINSAFSTIAARLFTIETNLPIIFSNMGAGIFQTVKIITDSITANTAIQNAFSLFRSLAQAITGNVSIAKISSFFKLLSQAITSNPISAAFTTFIKSIQQALSLSSITSRMLSLFRSLTQAAAFNLFGMKPGQTYSAAIGQALSLTNIAERTASIAKALSQFMTGNFVMVNVSSLFQSLTQFITESLDIAKFASRFQLLSQAITSNLSLTNINVFFKSLSQVITDNLSIAKVSSLFKSFTEAITGNFISVKLSSFFKSLAQAITENLSIARASSFLRSLSQAVTSSFSISGISSFFKSLSQAVTENFAIGRLSSFLQALAQSITSNLSLSKFSSLFRSISQTITSNFSLAGMSSMFKALTQAITGNTVVTSVNYLFKSLSQAITSNLTIIQISSLFRALSQVITENLSVVKVGNFLKTLAQSITGSFTLLSQFSQSIASYVSLAVNSAAQSVMAAVRNLTGAITANLTLVRISALFKSLTQTIASNFSTIRALGFVRTLTGTITSNLTYLAQTAQGRLVYISLTVNSTLQKTVASIRYAMDLITANLASTRMGALFRSLAQRLSTAFSSAVVKGFERFVSQTLGISNIATSFSILVKSIQQTLSLSSVVSRASLLYQSLTQAITSNTIVVSFSSFFKYLSQTITNSLATASQSLQGRLIYVSLSVSSALQRAITAVRTATGAITSNFSMINIASLLKSISQAIEENLSMSKISGFFATLSQQLSLSQITGRTLQLLRIISQALTSSTMIRLLSVLSRGMTGFFSLSETSKGTASIFKTVMDSFIANVAASGRQGIMSFVNIMQSINLTSLAARVASLSRIVSQTLNVSTIASRMASIFIAIYNIIQFFLSLFVPLPLHVQTQTVNLVANVSRNIDMQNVTNTTIDLVTSSDASNVVVRTESSTSYLSFGVNSLSSSTSVTAVKYVNVSITGLDPSCSNSSLVKIYYTSAELAALNLDESTLAIYKYNATSAGWYKLTTSLSFISSTGLNTSGKYVYVNTTQLSLFSIGGTETETPTPTGPPVTITGGGGGGGGVAAITPIVTLPTTAIEFTRSPVLREVLPGYSVLEGIVVKNTKSEEVGGLHVEVSGIPSAWVTVSPTSLTLKSGESKGFNILIAVPESAPYGDYSAIITLKNANVEDKSFFILRVKSFVPEEDKVITTRYVALDRNAGKSYVTLNTYNSREWLPRVDITEDIKKSIANSTDYVEFADRPDEIIQKDPIVMWSILDFPPKSMRNFSYTVSGILPEFSSYVYWPLNQLSVAYTKAPRGISVATISALELTAGRSTIAPITIENMENVSKNITLSLVLPSGWKSYPEYLNDTLNPAEAKTFRFSVIAPADAFPGYYIGRITIKLDGGTAIKEYQFVVVSLPEILLRILIVSALLITFVIAIYRYLKRRGKRRREMPKGRKKEYVYYTEKRV